MAGIIDATGFLWKTEMLNFGIFNLQELRSRKGENNVQTQIGTAFQIGCSR